MKHVFNNSELCHVWMHPRIANDSGKGHSMFFREGTIYSYGTHFPIAAHVQNKRGERAILYTTRSYSPSTAKHKGDVHRAIPNDTKIFYVQNPSSVEGMKWNCTYHRYNVKDYESRIKNEVYTLQHCRTCAEGHLRSVQSFTDELNSYIAFFNLRLKPRAVDPELANIVEQKEKRLKELETGREERAEKYNIARERKIERLRAALPDRITRWRAGENVELIIDLPAQGHARSWRYNSRERVKPDSVLLRMNGNNVETSLGASFPVSHVPLALRVIQSCILNKTRWETNGHSIHLGNYTIDSIDDSGNVKAGCHFVLYSEIERFINSAEYINAVQNVKEGTK